MILTYVLKELIGCTDRLSRNAFWRNARKIFLVTLQKNFWLKCFFELLSQSIWCYVKMSSWRVTVILCLLPYNFFNFFYLLNSVISRAPGLKIVVETLLASLAPIGNLLVVALVFFIIFGILGVQVNYPQFWDFSFNMVNMQNWCLQISLF